MKGRLVEECVKKFEAAGLVDEPARPKPTPVAERVDEKSFMAAVLRRAKELGWRCYHTHDSRRSPSGFPDLTLVRHGDRVVWAELKKHDGRVSAEQQNWLDDLRSAGEEVHVWRPADWPQIEETLLRRGK